MSTLLSTIELTDAELDQWIAALLDGKCLIVSQTLDAVKLAKCLYELKKLRAAAQPHPGQIQSHTPGGDERAAARTTPGVAPYVVWEYGVDPSWFHDYWDALAYSEHAAQRPSSVGDSKGNILHRFPRPETHPAPLSGAGHAELAPAADPAPPLGSAVGLPESMTPAKRKPCED